MKLGIIGKPQSGKTTIFNAAAGKQEAVGDYSQASHRAVIKVPDERVDRLAELVPPDKITYAEIEFLDAPGFTGKGKQSGGSEINPELKLMDALTMVIDLFSADAEPESSIDNLLDEMMLSDLTVVENNILKKTKKLKGTGDKSGEKDIALLKRCREALENEKPLVDVDFDADEEKLLRGYTFLSKKPLLIILNISEDAVADSDAVLARFADRVSPGKREVAAMCGELEMELASMGSEDRNEFMAELGITAPAVELVIQKSYTLLGLISFLTVGTPEVRAWTIPVDTLAQRAAGAIHSDIEKGFIRAEVTSYDDYIEHKTAAALKAAGRTRLEGKEYVVQDGDIMLFRFNV